MKLLVNNGKEDIWIFPESQWKEFTLGNFKKRFVAFWFFELRFEKRIGEVK